MAMAEEKALSWLQAALDQNRLAHAYLICGADGEGRLRFLMQVLDLVLPREEDGSGDLGMDLFGEVEACAASSRPLGGEAEEGASALDEALHAWKEKGVVILEPESKSRRITVDSLRAAERSLHVKRAGGARKVLVVLDADRLGVGAENAFLKTLEEPPEGSLLFLMTGFPERLLDTVRSRVLRMELQQKKRLLSDLSASERAYVSSLHEVLLGREAGLGRAMEVLQGFQDVLQECKADIAAEHEAKLKEEADRYQKTTEGDYLEQQEKKHKAQEQAEYLAARGSLLEILVSWLGDVLRLKVGGGHLEWGELRKDLEAVAKLEEAESWVKRLQGLEGLRGDWETNVQETLAMEVGFAKAFG